ncbi:IS110 family transposase [Streptomyces lunaelactis]|uniref:IS110 family transposase n=1 Tax=Streptomyces lunaelactis TaxID=1535768 RepID=UPI00158556DE|nr:IS110 family transposase [Streptomyces lunaelactis]NUK23501.1 IS110 family transposase [Streptomyces lunaelactis]NUK54333.1 IS110 family transposase [Streptomyces lunaelactis]NUK68079.1 IS110 family transposase [Streptomyces lunaelactis]NUL05503.1 IS110 family transposase [Streptomyces lunaelactis]
MTITCGIDWAEDHHDVALVDETGKLVAKRRITDDADGFRQLLALLVEAGDTVQAPIPVAVETARGLIFACLRAGGRKVYSINPMAVARYRERRSNARAKSDHADAMTLANILRTDADVHRPLPDDSELVQAIAVLARAQQDAVWNRAQLNNQLRSHLKQYYPAALAVFQVRGVGLDSREARAVLAVAPGPATAARLTRAQLRAALRKSGRQRNIETWVERLRTAFAGEYLHQLPLVEQAMARQTLALVAQLDAACRAADDLGDAAAEAFAEHPDAEVVNSFPGIGPLTGARVLAEIGDDRSRFADARALKAYAGSAPVTIASGKSHVVRHRRVKNQRLAAAGYVWIFGALPSPQVKAEYDRRRALGDRHTAAMRNVFNRLLGGLHHCLQSGQKFDPDKAFPTASAASVALAA